ncbi:MAG: hypothetical protein ABR981_03550 [Candidatus Micrarchaeaceae archaeon]|jgi:hypothetical protein
MGKAIAKKTVRQRAEEQIEDKPSLKYRAEELQKREAATLRVTRIFSKFVFSASLVIGSLAVYKSLFAGEFGFTATENLILIEYIDKNTNKIEANFQTVGQTGKFDVNKIVLNGLTEQGYWYQASVDTTYDNKTYLAYEVWDNKHNSIEPSHGGAASFNFNGKTNIGDHFNLEMEINNGMLDIKAVDLNTGAFAKEHLKARGSMFVGSTTTDKNGYSTSIFREMWVNDHFDLREISPQIVKLVYPKINATSITLSKSIYAYEYQSYNAKHEPAFATRFDFDRTYLETKPKYFVSSKNNIFFGGVEVGVSSDVFVTQGYSKSH